VIRAVVAALALGLLATACAPTTKPSSAGPTAGPATTPTSRLIAEHNARAALLRSLWARSVTQVWYPDQDNREQREQVEGHVSYLAPRGLVLTFMKVGEIGAVLGSNDERYWWAEVRDPKRALVGRHELADSARLDDFGLPVAPLDLLELMGLTQWPLDAAADGPRGVVASSRSGARAMQFGATGEPSRVELRDGDGRVRLAAELSKYESVARKGGAGAAGPRVPTLVQITLDGGRVRARLQLFDPEMGGSRRRAVAWRSGLRWSRLSLSACFRRVVESRRRCLSLRRRSSGLATRRTGGLSFDRSRLRGVPAMWRLLSRAQSCCTCRLAGAASSRRPISMARRVSSRRCWRCRRRSRPAAMRWSLCFRRLLTRRRAAVR
jgi:hypothetical protein